MKGRLLRVAIDDQIFTTQQMGGISRYFVEVITRLRQMPHLCLDIATPWSHTLNRHAADAGLGRLVPSFPGVGSLLRQINRVARARRGDIDVIHHSYYELSRIDELGSAPKLVTIHDMIPELFPEEFPNGNPHRHKRAYCEQAAVINCVSESTRRDLLAVYGPLRAEVLVTPLGVGPGFRPGLARIPNWPRNYILYVGVRAGYKDFSLAVTAFASLAGDWRDLVLMAVGGGPLEVLEREYLTSMGVGGRVLQVTLNDLLLPHAYANALALVLPSRYEGFGLPAAEAMASGCPAVLCQSSSLPEVGGDAARYFGVGDHETLANIIDELMRWPIMRKDLARAGLKQAATMRWERTAELTAAAYHACHKYR